MIFQLSSNILFGVFNNTYLHLLYTEITKKSHKSIRNATFLKPII